MIQRIFGLSGLLLVFLLFWVTYREFHPSWKKVQKEAYQKAYNRLREAASSATSEDLKVKYEKLAEVYKNPPLELKQILLQTGESERCITCHVDEDLLDTKHQDVKEFPFEIFGCTVCHRGLGVATEVESAEERKLGRFKGAHTGLLRNSKEMVSAAYFAESPCDYCHTRDTSIMLTHPSAGVLDSGLMLNCITCHNHREDPAMKKEAVRHLSFRVSHEDRQKVLLAFQNETPKTYIYNFWKRLRELTPPTSDPILSPPPTYREYNVDGKRLKYLGSAYCLTCHDQIVAYRPQTLEHVHFWQKSKFKTLDVVEKQEDYQNGTEEYRKSCFPCHTTGYDPSSGKYVERGVTCEACHGPGEYFAVLMQMGLNAFLAEQARKEAEKSGAASPANSVFYEVEYTDSEGKVQKTTLTTLYALSGATISRITVDRNVCLQCHTANYHEMRPEALELRRLKERPGKGYLSLSLLP